MDKRSLHVEVSSPDELRQILASHPSDGALFVFLRVLSSRVLVRRFHFPSSSTRDLALGLKMEAGDVLSIKPPEVEVSYQLTGEDEQGVYGVYAAMPRSLVGEYMDCFKGQRQVPVLLTACAVGAMDDFLKDNPAPGADYCLVHFARGFAVNIIIFSDGKPAFFRDLYDLSESDFEGKVKDTIRYSCSRSTSKKIDRIYFSGDLSGKEALIKSLKELESRSRQEAENSGPPTDLRGLNLFKKHVLELPQRDKLVSFFCFIIAVCLLLGLFFAWRFMENFRALHDPRLRVDMAQYQQAVDLQEELKRYAK